MMQPLDTYTFSAQSYHPKEQVFDLKINDKAKAYPFAELAKGFKQNFVEIKDETDRQAITICFDKNIKLHGCLMHKANKLPT
ncbi:MAG: hypothetical protein WBL28_05440 [Methylotenera sp.]